MLDSDSSTPQGLMGQVASRLARETEQQGEGVSTRQPDNEEPTRMRSAAGGNESSGENWRSTEGGGQGRWQWQGEEQ